MHSVGFNSNIKVKITSSFKRLVVALNRKESQHRQIAFSFLWVSLFILVGKIAGAAKEMTIAWRYGVSAKVDAYVFVFNLVNWPVSVWFSMLTVVLVPLVSRLTAENAEELPRFRAELLGFTLISAGVTGIIMWLGLSVLLNTGWLNLSTNALAESLPMANSLAFLTPIGILISLLSTSLLAVGQHRNTLFEAIPALTLLAFLLLPSGWMPEPLIWGTVAGYGLHMAGLAIPLHQRNELQKPNFSQRSPEWRLFWSSIGIISVGQVLMGFTTLLDQFFAASLGEGTLSTLSYANRILALVLGLGATAICRTTLPIFSAMQVNNAEGARHFALQWAKLMFAGGVLVLFAVWLSAPWIVKLLFERGAFSVADSILVSNIFSAGLLQVPFYACGLVLVSFLSAVGKYKAIAGIACINLFIKGVSNYVLLGGYGLIGLMYATAVMSFSSMLLCYIAVFKFSYQVK